MSKTEPKSIVARASCRVDLAGGTLDLWPLYLFHSGSVTVNFAVSMMTHCRITRIRGGEIRLKSLDTSAEDHFANVSALLKARSYKHPLAGYLCRFFLQDANNGGSDGFLLETHSDSPAGAGISGSSALMIATTAALARFTARKLSKEQIRVIAQNVEAQLINVPTGCQDYYPALYGGVSAIHLSPDGIHREALSVSATEINSRFVLAYTGAPRRSGINNWQVFKAHIDGDKRIFQNFADISSIAQSMRSALLKSDWNDVARLLHEEWKLRKTNAPGITTPLIDQLVASATKNGARAAKVCGAGGGGCVIFLVEPQSKQRVSEVITSHGGQILPFKLATKGLSVKTEQ
jgi:D-glycero-alpha-D-manno-heptose-7-phosphate kinase